MAKTSKIIFEQHDGFGREHTRYKVIRLTNRTQPQIGSLLKEDEVNELKNKSENLTIEIVPVKK